MVRDLLVKEAALGSFASGKENKLAWLMTDIGSIARMKETNLVGGMLGIELNIDLSPRLMSVEGGSKTPNR